MPSMGNTHNFSPDRLRTEVEARLGAVSRLFRQVTPPDLESDSRQRSESDTTQRTDSGGTNVRKKIDSLSRSLRKKMTLGHSPRSSSMEASRDSLEAFSDSRDSLPGAVQLGLDAGKISEELHVRDVNPWSPIESQYI